MKLGREIEGRTRRRMREIDTKRRKEDNEREMKRMSGRWKLKDCGTHNVMFL